MKERGIHEILQDSGALESSVTRRGFLTRGAAWSAALGVSIGFGHLVPRGFVPVAFAESTEDFVIEGKDGLRILNDRPLNAETLPHLLDSRVTPSKKLFIRNNGIPPLKVDEKDWRLTIDGESAMRKVTLSIADLKARYAKISMQLTLECGGNGRAEFQPRVSGNQWTLGAVGCPRWDGVRLRDVLGDAGIKGDAVYIGFYGADTHISGDPGKSPISRGVPIAKARSDEAMIAWGMNGRKLHSMNGHPLRLVIGGWPGSVSGKWLNRIVIRNQVHDGPKMGGSSYRVPVRPVAPGSKVDDSEMKIIESMPVKSLITFPETGVRHSLSSRLVVRGHAWAGDNLVSKVETSIDFGRSWQETTLTSPVNVGAWQHFATTVRFPDRGYYEVWARATDNLGQYQPMVLPGWNPKGYLNNACHRIAVNVV